MLNRNSTTTKDAAAKLESLNKSLAVIEFALDGTIVNANRNFLSTMGYTLDEVRGKHHSIFVDSKHVKSKEYKEFWESLARGEHKAAQYKRIGNGGKEVWIEASYNPVMDKAGRPYKVVKFATDITEQKHENADYVGQIAAISKSQAVIEFNLDGSIITANKNFLNTVGYSLDEIKGKHHSMFVDADYANSNEYKHFWSRLRDGEYQSGEYKRFGKGGKEVWIMASYNPIMDDNGKPFKVVKYATEITAQKLTNADYEGQISAISKSQAVIHFNMDGSIINANENFLGAVGYSLDEIKGKHHSLFVDSDYAKSEEYKEFWEKLNRGEYQSGEYKRYGKGGKEVWIMASYNPIMDMNGKPFKVMKYATEITSQMAARLQAGMLVQNSLASVQSIAAAVEEMTSSITDISKNMTLSQSAVEDIVLKAVAADEASKSLQNTSKAMANVVELIRNIAGQVNLLALNATIEAVRAGDAGKGFAVVASEVKNLANQASKATDDIAKEIDEMLLVAVNVADSITAISGTTTSVTQYVSSVASAIEEQSAVTREISSNMQRTSTGISEINDCVQKISGSKSVLKAA